MLTKLTWAVVGDCLNARKPASAVVARLKSSGKTVHLVNSRDETGQCFRSLKDIPESNKVEVVDLIISPKVGGLIVDDMIELKIPK